MEMGMFCLGYKWAHHSLQYLNADTAALGRQWEKALKEPIVNVNRG